MSAEITNVRYNEIGQEITIQLKYRDLEVLKFPRSCAACPVGFMMNHCGRNNPLNSEDYHERPDTCKLKKLDLSELFQNTEIKSQHEDLYISILLSILDIITSDLLPANLVSSYRVNILIELMNKLMKKDHK